MTTLSPWIVGLVASLVLLGGTSGQAAPGDLYVSDFINGSVSRFDGTTGALVATPVPAATHPGASGMAFLLNNDLIVGEGTIGVIARYEADGGVDLGTFTQGGGLSRPRGITRAPDGTFVVASRQSNSVLQLDPCSGDVIGTWATGGLAAPIDLEFAPNGHLFVASVENDSMVEYDAGGAFVRSYTTNLVDPVGIAIHPDGRVLVSDAATGAIESFDPTSGLWSGTFASGLSGPVDVEAGPNGNFFVANAGTDQVLELDETTGAVLGIFAAAPGVTPWGLAFEPAPVFEGAADVPGFDVTTYAVTPLPVTLSFAPDGTLFAGRQSVPDVLGPAVISRIPPGGGVGVDYGSTINDPDAVFFDASGSISGTPGSVIVGGTCTNSVQTGCFSAVLPDESVVPLFGPSTAYQNPFDFVQHPDGRLLVSDDNGMQVLDLTPTGPQTLYALPALGGYIDVRPSGEILTVANDGVVRIHDATGALLDGSFFSGLGAGFAPLAVGSGSVVWGDDLYAVDEVTGELLRIDSGGTAQVIGSEMCGDVGDLAFGTDDSLYVSLVDQNRVVRIAVPEPDAALVVLSAALAGVAAFRRGARAERRA